jgi:O-acetyl-ADP-ribose deacetylase
VEKLKETNLKGVRISLVKGDLTESNVDAIVNAANSHLQHGGGVAGAIVRRGGAVIQEESNAIGYVPVGECAITTGGRLKAPYVIHAVGPRWGEGEEEEKLGRAVRNTLRLAAARNFKSLSMPAISAGIFGFPKERCASIMVRETASFVTAGVTSLQEINFYLIDEEMVHLFEKEIAFLEKGS